MNLNHWDSEIHNIAADLEACRENQQDVHQRERLSLISLKISIFQLQSQLSSVLDKISNIAKRRDLLNDPRAKSLLHWSGLYSQRVREFYFQYVDLLGKQMWLKLIRTRTPGFHASPTSEFSDEHLIELSIRHKQLKDTKRLLTEHLAYLQKEKQRLKNRYADIQTIHANRAAAGSMYNNFGRTPREALDHPVIKRVKDMVSQIAEAARPLASKYSYLNDLQVDLSHHINRIVQQCKSLVIDELHGGRNKDKEQTTLQLEASKSQINQLREQLSIANSLFRTRQETIHPKIMKPLSPK